MGPYIVKHQGTQLVCVFCLHTGLATVCGKNTDLPCIKGQSPYFIYLFSLNEDSCLPYSTVLVLIRSIALLNSTCMLNY